MELITETNRRHSFFSGFIAGISIAIGYIPAALTFGLLAKATGLSLIETTAMSAFVYAGAAQYMALNLIVVGTGALELIFSTFIINIRHFLMSASLSEKVEKEHPLIKALYSFFITDEVFAVASTQPGRISTRFLFGAGFIAYSSWGVSSVIGYLAVSVLPEIVQNSMAIALYAMFIGLLTPKAKKFRKVAFLASLAMILNTILQFLLPSGWAIIFSTLLSSIIVQYIDPKGEVE